MVNRILVILAILALPLPALAGAFIEHISPPAIERGKTTRVTFVGHELTNAEDVWHSLSAGALKAKYVEGSADRAVFDIEVATTAPIGLLGVRLATRDGLSNAHLFLIDDLPVRPRSISSVTMRVELPAAVWGTFREAVVDRFEITVQAGQRVSFEAVGSRFGKDADPLLTVRDARGKWVTEHDNDPGLYFDCRFEYRFAEAGHYTIELRDARFHGSEHNSYVLRMGRFPAARVAVPAVVHRGHNALHLPELPDAPFVYELASGQLPGSFSATLKRPDDEGSTWLPLTAHEGAITVATSRDEAREKAQALSVSPAVTLGFNLSPLKVNPFLSLDALILTGRAQAQRAQAPGVFCGVLGKPGERHVFQFELTKGQVIHVRGEARVLNSPAELELILIDRTGRELKRSVERRDEALLDFTAGAPGVYGLLVRNQLRDGGNSFAYRITVKNGPFPPDMTADAEGLTVPQGSYQAVPIDIARNGTTGPIELKMLGGPAGLKLVHDPIGEKDNSIVCRLAADDTTPVGLYSVQIQAESSGGPTLVRTQPLIDRQLVNVDLIPHALREDQRRLPSSLTDRLAVQITPRAPFTMELPESTITLPRYQQANIPIVTSRSPGFEGPIVFRAKGGQLADKNEGRTRVYAEFPEATSKQLRVAGSIHSKILSNTGKTRIEVIGTGAYQGRRVSLTRTFELNLVPAYSFSFEPAKVSLLPGATTKIRLLAVRQRSFDGAVTVKLTPTIQGVMLPESIVVPKSEPGVDVEIKAAVDATPTKQNLQTIATALVNGFEEEQRGGALEVEVRKVETPKKK